MSHIIPIYVARPGEKCLAQWPVGCLYDSEVIPERPPGDERPPEYARPPAGVRGGAADPASAEERALVVDGSGAYAEYRLPRGVGAGGEWERVATLDRGAAVDVLVRGNRVPPEPLRADVAAGQFARLAGVAEAGWCLTLPLARSDVKRPLAVAMFAQAREWFREANELAARYGRPRAVICSTPGLLETPRGIADEADRQMTILQNWLAEQAAAVFPPATVVDAPVESPECGSHGAEAATGARRDIPRDETEILVGEWLAGRIKAGADPLKLTVRAAAAATGASTGGVGKTAVWKAFHKRRTESRVVPPRVVQLPAGGLEMTIDVPSELADLVEEQAEDMRADEQTPAAVRRRIAAPTSNRRPRRS